MGLITTMGKFCYVECDAPNCSKKMEHIDLKILRELADLCGWQNSGDRWVCPQCAENTSKPGRKKASKTARKSRARA